MQVEYKLYNPTEVKITNCSKSPNGFISLDVSERKGDVRHTLVAYLSLPLARELLKNLMVAFPPEQINLAALVKQAAIDSIVEATKAEMAK